MTLQERNTPNETLYAAAIALLYFDLLRAGEVRMIEVKDVKVTDNEKMKRIRIIFDYSRKRRNTGMDYYVPVDFLPVLKRNVSEIFQASVKQGRVQFLKNWSANGKRRVQNTGKHTINKLQKVACEILKLRPNDYGATHGAVLQSSVSEHVKMRILTTF